MIKIENSEVMGWEHAIRGMRNPMNSWEKSDSDYRKYLSQKCDECGKYNVPDENGQLLLKNLKKTYRISDEKNSFAINADDQIIRNVRKQFAKLGCIIKQRKGLRIKPRLLFLR